MEEHTHSDNRTDRKIPVCSLGGGMVTLSDSSRVATTGSPADPRVGHGIKVKRDEPFGNSDSYHKI